MVKFDCSCGETVCFEDHEVVKSFQTQHNSRENPGHSITLDRSVFGKSPEA